MEKEEFLPDDFLKEFFRNQQLESPGDQFVENVMGRIIPTPEAFPVKRSLLYYLRSSWVYAVLFLFCLLFLMTSDFSFTDFLPGKEYFTKNFLPYLGSLFGGIKSLLVNTKLISIPLMVILAGSLLIGLDHFVFRKPAARHQISQ